MTEAELMESHRYAFEALRHGRALVKEGDGYVIELLDGSRARLLTWDVICALCFKLIGKREAFVITEAGRREAEAMERKRREQKVACQFIGIRLDERSS